MLDFILDPINEFIRDMLKGWIEDNLSDLFVQLNSIRTTESESKTA